MVAVTTRVARGDAAYVWDLTACTREIEHWRGLAARVVTRLGGDCDAVMLARLGVTELISNVIKHVAFDPRCRLQVTREGDGLRIAVCDRSPEMPKASVPDWSSESGRGLWLLGEMALDWGVTRLAGGKAIWFRCPLVGGGGQPTDTAGGT